MIKVKPVSEDWRIWELTEDLDITIDDIKIHIPAGFKTDFASIPKIFWNILPPVGKYAIPSLVHDYLYYSCIVDKDTADIIFYKLMLKFGVPKYKAKLLYQVVKLFGKPHCGKMVDELEN